MSKLLSQKLYPLRSPGYCFSYEIVISITNMNRQSCRLQPNTGIDITIVRQNPAYVKTACLKVMLFSLAWVSLLLQTCHLSNEYRTSELPVTAGYLSRLNNSSANSGICQNCLLKSYTLLTRLDTASPTRQSPHQRISSFRVAGCCRILESM